MENEKMAVLFVLLALFEPVTAQAQMGIISKTGVIFIERSDAGQHLNFDFVLENRSNERLILNAITLSVFDAKGMLARREFVNEYSRANLELVGPRVLEPGTVTL